LCQFFIPDQVGDGLGVGACEKYEAFKRAGASEKPLQVAFMRLGNELFWGGAGGNPRRCEKFEGFL
jgi:hypothetical protein